MVLSQAGSGGAGRPAQGDDPRELRSGRHDRGASGRRRRARLSPRDPGRGAGPSHAAAATCPGRYHGPRSHRRGHPRALRDRPGGERAWLAPGDRGQDGDAHGRPPPPAVAPPAARRHRSHRAAPGGGGGPGRGAGAAGHPAGAPTRHRRSRAPRKSGRARAGARPRPRGPSGLPGRHPAAPRGARPAAGLRLGLAR